MNVYFSCHYWIFGDVQLQGWAWVNRSIWKKYAFGWALKKGEVVIGEVAMRKTIRWTGAETTKGPDETADRAIFFLFFTRQNV